MIRTVTCPRCNGVPSTDDSRRCGECDGVGVIQTFRGRRVRTAEELEKMDCPLPRETEWEKEWEEET